jgi:16S rRNA (guanine527-N7)-methyltransferase
VNPAELNETSSRIYSAAADLFGLTLSPEQVALFELYLDELLDWNHRINLTSIMEPDAVRLKHFLDSFSVLKAVPVTSGMHVMDVGTGAGFPGLPLHIVIQGLHTTLLESTGKKIPFLDAVIAKLGLTDVKTVNARAEDAGQLSHHRAKYDLVLARAVARLPILVEYLLPFARVGGYCIAMKGGTVFDEAKDAEPALAALKGRLVEIIEVELPGLEDKHYLAVIEKTGQTPGAYPRKPGIPAKKPIM